MEDSIWLVPEGTGPVWAEFRGERIYFADMWTARKVLDEFAPFGIKPSAVELPDGTAQVRYSWSAIAQAKFEKLSGLMYARGFKQGRERALIQGDLSK